MNVDSLHNLLSPSAMLSGVRMGRADTLNAAPTAFDRELDEAAIRERQQREQTREAAEQLVASAFVLPFLQQVRNEPLRANLFHGGFSEDAFGQQLDTHLADMFVQSGNFPLVDAVERHMTRGGRGGVAAAGGAGGYEAIEPSGQKVNTHG